MRILWLWGPVALQMALIFAASSIPNLTSLPGDVSDHTGHFIGYAILGALVLRALAQGTWSRVTPMLSLAAWSLSVAYGASDEWHQTFVSGRSATVDDWIADGLGAAAAVGTIVTVAAARRARSREV
jgi:VanZ family protein